MAGPTHKRHILAARMVAGRAGPLPQIRLSALQELLVTPPDLGGKPRRLLGPVAPAGACSSHRNPRRGGRGVSEALYIWRAQSSSQA